MMVFPRAGAVMLLALSGLALMAAGAWRGAVLRSAPPAIPPDTGWERVQEQYPAPAKPPEEPTPAEGDPTEAVLEANPFSPMRRSVPPVAEATGTPAPAKAEHRRPIFVYKGRIQLGARERAIVEDLQAKKTHFLEVGQEVAGFKVLDIAEDRVLLSDPQSREEVALSLTTRNAP